MPHQRRIVIAWAFALFAATFLACTGTPNQNASRTKQAASEYSETDTLTSHNATSAERADARTKARAKAEAEAEAKNEANRKVYEAEVERIQTAHAEELEKYRVEKESYDTALAKYKMDKKEFAAGELIKLARMFIDRKQTEIANRRQQTEIANRRLREIIKDYPDTQAAKDAKVLLSDGYVKIRDTSIDPVPPIAPVEPRLVLPSPPPPTAVIYPPDADESKLPDSDYVTTRTGDYQTPINLGNGKTVYVRGYYRNGTYVQPYMRSQPGSGSKTTSGGRHK